MSSYLTLSDLADLLGISPATARNRISQGMPMPPGHKPPGCRSWLFRLDQVQAWIEGDDAHEQPAKPKKRGRPTKAAQVAAARRG